jgi:hypothetical protein
MRPFRIAPLVVAACLAAAPATAAPVLIEINFDSLLEGDLVTAQFDGVTFSGATVITSGAIGGGLNETDYPPHSDFNVVFNSDSEIQATFGPTGATHVGAFITYSEPVTMTAFNGSLVLGSVTSLFTSNVGGILGDPGSTPNEEFLFTSPTPITHVTFANLLGSPFVLDDFSAVLVDADQTPVPEPATASLVALGAALLIRKRKTRAARRA